MVTVQQDILEKFLYKRQYCLQSTRALWLVKVTTCLTKCYPDNNLPNTYGILKVYRFAPRKTGV